MQTGKNILLIDKSELIVFYMKMILWDIKGVSDVEITHRLNDAKKILETQRIDFIVIDINLEGEGVLPFLRWAKNNNNSVKIIVFSNHTEKTFHNTCKASGANYVLDKSLEVDRLVKLLTENEPAHNHLL